MKNWTIESDLENFLQKNRQFQQVRTPDGVLTLKGIVRLEDETGYLLEVFEIMMKMPLCYPKCFPFVWETSNKIPHDIDWHIVVNDENRLCLIDDSEEKLVARLGINLDWFLEKALKPYLAGQAFRLNNPGSGYPQGERPHNIEGNLDFFKEFLKTNSTEFVIQALEESVDSKKRERNQSCFCGSRKKFKKCHLQKIEELQQIGIEHLKQKIQKFKTIQ